MPKGSAANSFDEPVSASQLGKLLGISERRVRELRDDGVIPDDGVGQYVPAAAVPAYCRHLRPATGKGAAGGADVAHALDSARIRVLTAQAIAREMLNDQLRGETVLSGDMEAEVGAVFEAVRAKLLALPTRAAPVLAGLTKPGAILEKLTELVHAALDELATPDAVIAAIYARARASGGQGTLQPDGDPLSGAAATSSQPVG